MANPEIYKQGRGLVAIDGAMALIAALPIVQIWLLSATLETFLRGRTGPVLPATIFSGLIFWGCLALDFFVTRVDPESRKPQ